MAAGWLAVAAARVAGLPRIAALGAALGLVGAAVSLARRYAWAPDSLVSWWWLLTLTAVTAACLLVALRDPEPPPPLAQRAVLALATGALVMAVEPLAVRALMVVRPGPEGSWQVSERIPGLPTPVSPGHENAALAGAVLAVAFLVLVVRLHPAVRRRVLLLTAPTAPTAAVVVLVRAGFQGFLVSSPRFWPPVSLTLGQWGALLLVPPLVFAAGAALLRRYERKLASGALLSSAPSPP
jgi:hypothetical protein